MENMIKVIKKIYKYFKNNIKKSHLVLFGCGLLMLIVGIFSWKYYFSNYYLFSKNEELFLETVERYFEYHSIYLPKSGNIKTVTLEELYKDSRIDVINIPNKNISCSEDSWVKVYNDNGKYIYHTYLKCGKYETKVDHEGPEIKLNGDSTIYVSLGKEYKEPGVKSVKDNKDGNISVENVKINSKVNTKKTGTYTVKYSAKDKLNNLTEVTRKVIVVRNLTDIVKDSTDESNYYKGNINNNYLLFSGMMFRIIGAKDDGSVLIISDEVLNNLRIDSNKYENSNMDKYLNNVYLNIINDKKFIQEADYCVDDITTSGQATCDKTIKRMVSMLSAYDFYKTFENDKSFLCGNISYALTNYSDGKNVNSVFYGYDCMDILSDDNQLPAIKPVLTLKKDLVVSSGKGTKTNPYKLNDYNYGKTHDKINTRLVGEYVNYSGYVFRIIKTDKDYVQLIAIDGMKKYNSNSSVDYLNLVVPNNGKDYTFNVKDNNNPGYIINDQYIDYINDSNLISYEYKIPTNESKVYSNYKTSSVKTKISLPKTYDLFSGVHSTNVGYMYLYLDKSLIENHVFNVNVNNGKVFDDIANQYGKYCFKPVITVKGDLKIKSGKGTINSPYYINK